MRSNAVFVATITFTIASIVDFHRRRLASHRSAIAVRRHGGDNVKTAERIACLVRPELGSVQV